MTKIGPRIVIYSKWRRFCTSRPPDQKPRFFAPGETTWLVSPTPWNPHKPRLGLRSPNVERSNLLISITVLAISLSSSPLCICANSRTQWQNYFCSLKGGWTWQQHGCYAKLESIIFRSFQVQWPWNLTYNTFTRTPSNGDKHDHIWLITWSEQKIANCSAKKQRILFRRLWLFPND